VKKAAQDVLARMHKPDPLLDIAMQLEEIALADDFFVSRKLYPNVDFYTGLIYKALGFPPRMFTVLFALGRLPGWIAQWREMMIDPANKIGRPRQIYTRAGEQLRPPAQHHHRSRRARLRPDHRSLTRCHRPAVTEPSGSTADCPNRT